jgi:hypothetical protein
MILSGGTNRLPLLEGGRGEDIEKQDKWGDFENQNRIMIENPKISS